MAQGDYFLNMWRVCPICGKKFMPEPLHVYKDKSDPDRKLVCTYHCMRESERLADEKRERTSRNLVRKRLDPATMTKDQLRRQRYQNGPKCGECVHMKCVERDGETRAYCTNAGNENGSRSITVRKFSGGGYNLVCPRWCLLRKKEDDGT